MFWTKHGFATLEHFAHIFSTFLAFLPGAKPSSSFTNVAPCGAGNFVNNVALMYFFGTKFGSRECFYWYITCSNYFLSNLVIGSVRPLMYGRAANPPVRGGSTHLRVLQVWGLVVGKLFFFVIWVMRFVG